MKKMAKPPVKKGKKKLAMKVIKPKKTIKAKSVKKTIKRKTIPTKTKTKKLVVKPSKTKIKAKKITMPIKKITIKKTLPVKPRLSRAAVGPVDVKPYHPKPGEKYMNNTQLEHLKNILLNWKEQLLQEAETTKQDIQASSANFPDPVDRASLEEEFNLELRTRDRERKLIKKIEEALQRIQEISYGYCDDCGAEIGLRRLEARPTATQCIECKTVSELKEKQVGEVGKEEE